MSLTEAFSAMPNVTGLGDLPDAWHWSNAPGLDTSAVLSADGKHAFQAHARDSFDEGFAVALLSFAREHSAELIDPMEPPLVLAEGFAHPGYAFDTVAAIGPAVHGLFPHDAEARSAVRAVVPAFRCEFAGDEDKAETAYLYNRAAGVPGTKWGRQPRPFLKVRFRGDNGRLPAERAFFMARTLVSWTTGHEGDPNLFVEFENYRREVYTVEWTDTWTITAPGATPRETTREDLLDTVKAALYGPNIDAGTGEFPSY